MKKTILLTMLVGCTMLVSLQSCENEDGKNDKAENGDTTQQALPAAYAHLFENEVLLNLDGNTVEFSEYRDEAGWFQDYFKVNVSGRPRPFSELQYEQVKYAAILEMLESIQVPATLNNKHFTGVRIVYGLTEDQKVKLYYIPAYAKANTTPINDNTDFEIVPQWANNTADLLANKDVYTLDADGILKNLRGDNIKIGNAEDDIDNYWINIRIHPTKASAPRPHSSDGAEDAKSVFFPFQEIVALYNDNLEINPHLNGLFFASTSKYVAPMNRHLIIMSPINPIPPTDSAALGTFTNKAANLGQLCPPHCPSVKVKIKTP